MQRISAAVASLFLLAGCQSTTTYQPIVPNPENIDIAMAKCQMLSSSTQQSMVAWGSPSYVAGAQIGNSIGNAIRADQFVQQCMTIQGWKQVSVSTNPPPAPKTSFKPVTNPAETAKINTIDMFAMRRVAEICKLPIRAEQKTLLKTIASQEPNMATQGALKGEHVIADAISAKGRRSACEAVAHELRGMNWLQ
ncbi:hypothetical protein ACQZ4R_12815 [Agrobacterium vitis]